MWQKILKIICILFDPTILFLRMYPKEGKKNINIHNYFSLQMLIMALVKIEKKTRKKKIEAI